jgi:hypothetical protein
LAALACSRPVASSRAVALGSQVANEANEKIAHPKDARELDADMRGSINFSPSQVNPSHSTQGPD